MTFFFTEKFDVFVLNLTISGNFDSFYTKFNNFLFNLTLFCVICFFFCRFPCAKTANLLIQCGADVNAMDRDRNTPLHMIVNYQKPISDFVTLHSIIMDLTEAGAHIDCVNNKGETPLDSTATGTCKLRQNVTKFHKISKKELKFAPKTISQNLILFSSSSSSRCCGNNTKDPGQVEFKVYSCKRG